MDIVTDSIPKTFPVNLTLYFQAGENWCLFTDVSGIVTIACISNGPLQMRNFGSKKSKIMSREITETSNC
jgi:hypothetical protein